MPAIKQRPSLLRAVWRGLQRRCPNCGRGPLMATYLRQVDQCAMCGEPYGHIRADDAPPWLTILAVGHVVVPTAIAVESMATWPVWMATIVWATAALALSAAVLPRAKGLFLAAIWSLRAPGSEAG
jgi:uncharacterized protein (DUF983 family)